MNELKEKLKNSSPVLSLAAEEEVRRLLESMGWKAVHSAYYKDITTQKTREIDVIGHRFWEKRGEDEISLCISLLVECKSMDRFHLVFSKANSQRLQFQSTDLCSWIGYLDYPNRRSIVEALAEFGYRPSDVSDVITEIERISYPDDQVRISDLILEPFPEYLSTTSYCETNIKTEKDLDNSVLWRSMQSLYSAVSSLRTSWGEVFLENLSFDALLAERENSSRLGALNQTIDRSTSHVIIYHPVVVLNAQMWASSNGELEQIPWCRFYQHDAQGHVARWCDIVQAKHMEEYFQELTKHYVDQAVTVGAREPIRADIA